MLFKLFLAGPVKKSLVGPQSGFYVVKDMYPAWDTGLWRGREHFCLWNVSKNVVTTGIPPSSWSAYECEKNTNSTIPYKDNRLKPSTD